MAEKTTNKSEKTADNVQIEKMLFKQVKKPKGLHEVRISNVFDNRYRINVWTATEEDNLTKMKIHSSYFAHLKGEELVITSGI
jgi:hypothetical protein